MQPGNRLGPYAILEPLGKGGMGEVYLAEDTRLGRKVAVKVLPDELAGDPQRLARFEQEAQAAAALNHPHIAAVYDVGHERGLHYIVQEYLAGRSLRQVISDNRLGLGRALTIASEAASGLAAAHRVGIVHRDVKPENLFLTAEDRTKVLDFGIAKRTPSGLAGEDDAGALSTRIGTTSGAILGSVGYMAPEQVEAGEIDGRTDVFGLGCVLYELIAGRRPFQRSNPHATLSAILTEDPEPLSELRPQVPPRVAWIVDKCLAKEPSRRYQHMDDLTVDLRSAAELEAAGRLGTAVPDDARPSLARRLAPGLGLLAALTLLLAGWFLRGSTSGPAPAEQPLRTTILLPESAPVVSPFSFGSLSLAVSPDGSSIVYAGQTPEGTALFQRNLGDASVTRLPGTEGASMPVFAPDGRRVAFYTSRELRHVPLGRDERSSPLTETRNHVSSAVWLSADRILYTDFDSPSPRLASLGDTSIRSVPEWRRGLIGFAYPTSVLGDGLVLGLTAAAGPHVAFVGPLEGPPTELLSRVGWMVGTQDAVAFVQDRSLYGARWTSMDPPTLGPPRVLADGLAIDPEWYGAQVAVGGSTLAWVEGPPVEVSVSLSVVEQDGAETLLSSDLWSEAITFSPDGERILFSVHDLPDDHHVWIYDPRDGSRVRVAAGIYSDYPIWGPDGRSVFAFHVADDRTVGLGRFFDNGAPPEHLLESAETVPFPGSLHPDGSRLLYRRNDERTGADLMLLELGIDADPTPFLQTNDDESQPRFSSSGEYVAYVSDESGQDEIYVRAFPAGQPVWRVSEGGGSKPRWSADGSQLFFLRGSTAWAVPVRIDDSFSSAPAVQIFETDGRLQDISPDGRRFLITRHVVIDQPSRTIEILANWTSFLER